MKVFEIGNLVNRGGEYSTVVIESDGKSIYKIFKSFHHPDLDETDNNLHGEFKINFFRREVFKSEVKAYLKVQESELLKEFTPKFYGTHEFEKITLFGQDITSQYLADCCLKLEYIQGDEYKIQELVGYDLIKVEETINMEAIDIIIEEFNRAGINYLEDASIILNHVNPKFIDFGTHKIGDYPFIGT